MQKGAWPHTIVITGGVGVQKQILHSCAVSARDTSSAGGASETSSAGGAETSRLVQELEQLEVPMEVAERLPALQLEAQKSLHLQVALQLEVAEMDVDKALPVALAPPPPMHQELHQGHSSIFLAFAFAELGLLFL